MFLRCVCWSIFLCLSLVPIVKAEVTVDEQGYQNVMISFEPNVDDKYGDQMIAVTQNVLQRASSALQQVIGIPIASATFLIPSSWSTEKWKNLPVTPASLQQTTRKSDIRVDEADDSPFATQAVALQHGGCGVPGHQIILNKLFIFRALDYPKGKLIAREWLKYRYGVFDEGGFLDDELYPIYYKVPGKPGYRITECTDFNITYTFMNRNGRGVCSEGDIGLDGYCRTSPDENFVANVTSSLLYFHKDLRNMEHICGKDGYPHNSLARNKQNNLCNGRSIWDVMKSSEDFKKIQQQHSNQVPKPIKFSYVQESKPRFVVLLEESDKFGEEEIESAIRFAVRRFYYDVPPKSKLAIYTFNSDVKAALNFTQLPAQGRSDLGAFADFASPEKNICTSCGLAQAAQILLQDREVGKGSILLITASPLDKVPELSEKLKDAGICLHVLRFTDENNTIDQTYDALAKSFYCFSQESLKTNMSVVDAFDSLSRFLKNYVPEYNNFEIKTVTSGNMTDEIPVTIPRDKSAEFYTLWLNTILGNNSIECREGNITINLTSATSATEITSFTFNSTANEVTCRLSSEEQPPVLTQVQVQTKKGHYLNFDVWIHDESTDEEQLPIIIYAKIYFGGYLVKHADVFALVTVGNRQEAVELFDNGIGDPDITQYDGIYSGYFSGILEKESYQITVRATDNRGYATIGKDYKSLEGCCGSKINSMDFDGPAFSMEKIISYTAKNKRPADGYPPSKIRDLKMKTYRHIPGVYLSWTAPGGGKVVKYVVKVFENREDAITKFETSGQDANASSVEPRDTGLSQLFFIPFETLDEDTTYYAAIRSWNEFNRQSETSNVVEFVPKDEGIVTTTVSDEGDPENNNTSKTIGIVFGVLGGIAVVCSLGYLGYYFFVKRRRQN